MGPLGGRTVKPLADGRLVERSSFRGRGRVCIRGDDGGSFFTVILGGGLAFRDLRPKVSALDLVPGAAQLTGKLGPVCQKGNLSQPSHLANLSTFGTVTGQTGRWGPAGPRSGNSLDSGGELYVVRTTEPLSRVQLRSTWLPAGQYRETADGIAMVE